MKHIDTKKARTAGVWVSAWDARSDADVPEAGYVWLVRCEEHGDEAWMQVRRDAQVLATEPEEFCEGCAVDAFEPA
ncbi:hypothetical protein [Nocardioides nanhaiensis]|uniref:Uncharacterized protein n=1 Tax=Nocardioides nanhaiensis TaxID=1476871 RepID=A0ABP8X3R5_9ACTN